MQFSIETGVIAGFTALALKVIEYVYAYAKEKLSKEETVDKQLKRTHSEILEIQNVLKEIVPVLSKTDVNGVNMIYFPRHFLSQQEISNERTRENLDLIARGLDHLTLCIEGLSRIIDKLENKLNYISK